MSETILPILTKFCVSSCNVQVSINARVRKAAVLKIVKCDISITVILILMKFGMVMRRLLKFCKFEKIQHDG